MPYGIENRDVMSTAKGREGSSSRIKLDRVDSAFASRRVVSVLNALRARGVAIPLILENEETSNGQCQAA
jgi:hypothetical protein